MKPTNPSRLARAFLSGNQPHVCPLIDMHGHFGPFMGGYLPAADPAMFRRALRRAGVKRIVSSAHEALLGDFQRGNRAMQTAIHKNPDILSGYWGINPNHEASWRRAAPDFKHSHGFVGFKFLPDYHVYPLDGPHYTPAMEYADARGLLVLVHTWGGSAFNAPHQIEQVAQRYPGVRWLMGHSGYGDWATALRIARDYENVYLELTAVYVAHDFAMFLAGSGTPAPLNSCLQVNGIIEEMVATASSRKILMGTDMPWYSPLFAAGAVLFARLDDIQRHDILHHNAERLLAPLRQGIS